MTDRLLERPPGVKEFEPMPAAGALPPVNPPPFRWLAHEGVARWRVELVGPGGEQMEFGPLHDPILALRQTLPPGEWTWQVIGLNLSGNEVGRGQPRTFTVADGLPGFVVPDVTELEEKWRGLRPRLFGKRIAMVREHLDGEFAAPFEQLQAWCRIAESEPLIDEPAGYRLFPDDHEEHTKDWRRIYSAARISATHAVRFALSYLLTDNAAHLEHAKRWTMHLLSWNPFAITSLRETDEAGMPLLERLSLVYDWLHGHWTEIERERFLRVMVVRGEEARERDAQVGFAARPFFNHRCRTLAFTGTAGVAFLGDIPQATEWLQYILDVMAVSYPSGSWGGDDGGWAQGHAYWSGYMSRLAQFVAAASELGIDFAASPYYRNTGYFPVYNLPPKMDGTGFGDGAFRPAGFAHKLVVGAFGVAAADGYLRAYADAIDAPLRAPEEMLAEQGDLNPALRWDAWEMTEVRMLLLTPDPGLAAKDLRELPPARVFPYIGWAAMHSAMGDAKNDAWVQFKSSPFGSVSHSHADQNSFNLFAYGEGLLIDSGYYPWYASPHDALWTNQTWAHNAMLIDGRGQAPYDWFARGKIEAFESSEPFVYVRGEAAEAYNRPAPDDIVALAEKHCPELVEKMTGPAAEVVRASRSVLMVNGPRPYFVVLDWLETATPATFQWLGHAYEEMQIRGAGFEVQRNDARLTVQFIAPAKLSLSQKDQFPVAPEALFRDAPNQWHLTAATTEKSTTARFMAILVPYGSGDTSCPETRRFRSPAGDRTSGTCPPRCDEPLVVEPLHLDGLVGAKVGDDIILAPATGVTGPISYEGIDAHAALVVISGANTFIAEAVEKRERL
jgi:uncharacterized protein DUF4962/heparinase II/III-like protein